MKKRQTFIKTIIAIISILTLLLCAVGCSSEVYVDKADKPTTGIIELSPVLEQGIKLSSSGGTNEEGLITKTVIATVMPEHAPNRKVAWSLSWNTYKPSIFVPDNIPISDYVSLEVSEENSNQVTLTCLQAFPNTLTAETNGKYRPPEATLSCTTEEGGFRASAVVRYVGYVTSMTISASEYPYGEHPEGETTFGRAQMNGVNVPCYFVPTTNYSCLKLELDNVYECVQDTEYIDDLFIRVVANEDVLLKRGKRTVVYEGDPSNVVSTEFTTSSTVPLSTVVNQLVDISMLKGTQIGVYYILFKSQYSINNFHTASSVTETETGGVITYEGAYELLYPDMDDGVFTLAIDLSETYGRNDDQEPITLSFEFNVCLTSLVESVSLDNSKIEF